MFCQNCGSEVQEGNSFCSECGTNIASDVVNNVYDQPVTAGNGTVKKSMNVLRIIASVVVIVSTFMPFVSVFSYTKSLIEGGDGYIFMSLAVLVIICDVLRRSAPAMIFSVVTLALAVYEVIDTNSVSSDFFGLIEYSIGFYLLIIGAIAMVVAGPIHRAITGVNIE